MEKFLCPHCHELCGKHKRNCPSRTSVSSTARAVRRLTHAQKRELDLLRKGGGYCHVFDGNLLRVFDGLSKKGYVELTAGGGQLQTGTHVSLIEKDV